MRTAFLLMVLATAAAAPGLAGRMIDVEHATTCGAAHIALRVHPPLTLSPHAGLAVALRARAACLADGPGDAAGADTAAALRLSGRLSLGARTALVAAVQFDAGGLRAWTRRAW